MIFPSTPAVKLPLFLQMFRYASTTFSSETISFIRCLNCFPCLLCSYKLQSFSCKPIHILFWFVYSFLRHSNHRLSACFFFLIPEAMKSPCDYYIYILNILKMTCAYPSTAYYHRFIGTVALLSQSWISLYGLLRFRLNISIEMWISPTGLLSTFHYS